MDSEKLKKKLLSNVVIDKETGCWNWQKGCNTNGHGRMRVDNKFLYVHRVSYLVFKGIDPGDLCVCHKCDNPQCVNPVHLFLGTQSDNMKDMVNKGRAARGSSHGRARLTETDVLKIRESVGISNVDLAVLFGVSDNHISNIRSRKRWAHVK